MYPMVRENVLLKNEYDMPTNFLICQRRSDLFIVITLSSLRIRFNQNFQTRYGPVKIKNRGALNVVILKTPLKNYTFLRNRVHHLGKEQSTAREEIPMQIAQLLGLSSAKQIKVKLIGDRRNVGIQGQEMLHPDDTSADTWARAFPWPSGRNISPPELLFV
ncbi:hypothetical protein C0J52_27277 [Blattella germanica]|nr:hypothetical protein C0J52_27277 [Blattella germanica]